MLATTHTLVGAAVGKELGNPYLSLVFGIALHFLFDKIPHFWPKKRIHQGIILAFDWLFCLGFLIYSFVQGDDNLPVFFGALGGFSVDFVLLTFAPIRKSAVGKYHIRAQHHRRNPLYVLVDVLVIFLSIYILGRI